MLMHDIGRRRRTLVSFVRKLFNWLTEEQRMIISDQVAFIERSSKYIDFTDFFTGGCHLLRQCCAEAIWDYYKKNRNKYTEEFGHDVLSLDIIRSKYTSIFDITVS